MPAMEPFFGLKDGIKRLMNPMLEELNWQYNFASYLKFQKESNFKFSIKIFNAKLATQLIITPHVPHHIRIV